MIRKGKRDKQVNYEADELVRRNTTLKNLKVLQRTLKKLVDGKMPKEALPKEFQKPYSQRIYVHPCGTPACAFGWYIYGKKELDTLQRINLRDPTVDMLSLQYQEFPDLHPEEMYSLFGSNGCGEAGNDAAMALAYITNFIKRRYP